MNDLLPAGTEDYVHIRIQQKKNRWAFIAVQGIADNYNEKKLVKVFKKKFGSNGTVSEHPEYKKVFSYRVTSKRIYTSSL